MTRAILAGLALFFAACAPTLPPTLNTTEWAKNGDTLFAIDSVPRVERFQRFDELASLQARIAPTNLVLRQHLLHAAAGDTAALRGVREQFVELARYGYWAEGYSYFVYVREPLLWYARVTGREAVPRAVLDGITARYAALASPTGEIPLPEVSRGLGLPPGLVEPRGQSYRVWRSPGSYLLLATGTDPEPRLNLHRHLEAGYFALWTGGEWRERCAPYEGFDKSDPATEGGFYRHLPRGAVTPNLWRVRPVRLTVKGEGDTVAFRWRRAWWALPVSRRVEVTADSVVVIDAGVFSGRRRAWAR
jgi:hypothetical protein